MNKKKKTFQSPAPPPNPENLFSKRPVLQQMLRVLLKQKETDTK